MNVKESAWEDLKFELPVWAPPKGVSGYMTRTGTLLQALRAFSCFEVFAQKLIDIPAETVILAISCRELWHPDSGRNKYRLLGLMDEREVILCFDNYHDYYIENGNGPHGGCKKHRALSLATYFQSIYTPPEEDL